VRSRRHGVVVWGLTSSSRRSVERAGKSVGLPESPQHRVWRHAQALAAERIDGLWEQVRVVLEEATGALNAGGVRSDGWFALADRLQSACWQLGSATYCLSEWAEPDDARADVDDAESRVVRMSILMRWAGCVIGVVGGATCGSGPTPDHKRTGCSMRSERISSLLTSAVTGVVLAGIVSMTSTSTRSSLTGWSATGSYAPSSPRPSTGQTCGSPRGSRGGCNQAVLVAPGIRDGATGCQHHAEHTFRARGHGGGVGSPRPSRWRRSSGRSAATPRRLSKPAGCAGITSALSSRMSAAHSACSKRAGRTRGTCRARASGSPP
jgi:hypothetical protein